MTMSVGEAIQSKRAVRHFSDQPLSDEVIERILHAGRRAQSSKNTQPWDFIVVRDRERLEALSKTGAYLAPVARAQMCIAIVTPNVAPEDANWIAFDAGQCAAYMQLAAQELGVGSVIGAVHFPEEARGVLRLPADKRVDAVISFGYPAPSEQGPLRAGGRRPLAEMVHWETWQEKP